MRQKRFVITLIFGAICIQVSAQQYNRYRLLDSVFSSWYNTGKFSGNILIAEHGKPVYQKSFGFINIETQQPLNENSMFLLGSVSKQFTAFGIVLLKERRELKYSDDIQKYFPQLPYKNITIRNLLTHTSGIPDYISLMNRYWDKSKFASNKDVLNMLIQYHPEISFQPGNKYEYSNTGYALLALIIEKVSGLSYQQFMEQDVFKPLGMTRTIVYTRRFQPKQISNYALGYVYNDSLHQYELPDMSPAFKNDLWEDGVVGEDGVNSTTIDMLVWDRALYGNKLVSDSSLAQIFMPAKVGMGVSDYGFGWHIRTFPLYGKISYHSGGWPGYIAYIERHIDNDKTIIVLRNKFTPETRLPIDLIRSILYNQKIQTNANTDIADSLLNKYIGEYRLNAHFSMKITRRDSTLYVQGTNQPVLLMTAITRNKFYVKGPEATIEFISDANGNGFKLILNQKGQTVEAMKVNN